MSKSTLDQTSDSQYPLSAQPTGSELNFLYLMQDKPSPAASSQNLSTESSLALHSSPVFPAERASFDFIAQAIKHSEKATELTGVSENFGNEVHETYHRLSIGVRHLLEKNGYKVIAAHHITQVCPYLIGHRPGGWGPGCTWDNVEGTVVESEKAVVIAEYKKPMPDDHASQPDVWIPSRRPEGVLRHEVGHAVDHLLGSEGHLFSGNPEFKTAYELDVSNMAPADKYRLGYYLQEYVGRGETFADMLAMLNGGAANASTGQTLSRAFPEVAALMKRRLEALDQEEQ